MNRDDFKQIAKIRLKEAENCNHVQLGYKFTTKEISIQKRLAAALSVSLNLHSHV